MDNCWGCNRPGHHRRDCNVTEKGDVTLNKKTVEGLHTMWQSKQTNKQKFLEKLEARDSVVLPRQLLRQHMDVDINIVYEMEYLLTSIGTPCSTTFEQDLVELVEAELKLRSNLDTMRDNVSRCKNYVYRMKKVGAWDLEDKIFQYTLEYLDKMRQPVFSKCNQVLAHLKELKRQIPQFNNSCELMESSLTKWEKKLGERSPSVEDLEKILCEALEKKLIIEKLKNRLEILQQFSDCSSEKQRLSAIFLRFDTVCMKRGEVLQDVVNELKSVNDCDICFELKKDFVLDCGHRICANCLGKILDKALCPFCKQRFHGATKLF